MNINHFIQYSRVISCSYGVADHSQPSPRGPDSEKKCVHGKRRSFFFLGASLWLQKGGDGYGHDESVCCFVLFQAKG